VAMHNGETDGATDVKPVVHRDHVGRNRLKLLQNYIEVSPVNLDSTFLLL
jgi:hypothetical protein